MLWCLAVAKNIEQTIPVFAEFIQTLLTHLSDTQIWIYENNSKDSTKSELEKLVKPNVHLISETLTDEQLLGRACTKENKPCRMEAIASARNRLLDSIGPNMKDDDIVLWIDPDMPRVPVMETLIHWIRNFPAWADALFANGLSVNGKYFDSYAYRDKRFPFGYELLKEGEWIGEKNSAVQIQRQMNEPMIPVYSAFGGMALYRAKAIKGLRYSGTPTEDYAWFVEKTLRENPDGGHELAVKKETDPQTHIDGRLQGVYLFGRWFWNSSGYNFPVLCEHVTLHASMIHRGFDKLFVCPSLVYFSDHFA